MPHCAAAACVAVLLLPVSPWCRSLCHHWAVASCTAVCCCPHCHRCHRHAARCVAIEQLQVVQWCAAACTTTATTMLIVSLLCGCHHCGRCHWVVPAHTI